MDDSHLTSRNLVSVGSWMRPFRCYIASSTARVAAAVETRRKEKKRERAKAMANGAVEERGMCWNIGIGRTHVYDRWGPFVGDT